MHNISEALDNLMNSMWPDGTLRCRIDSPVRRLISDEVNTFTQTILPDPMPDIHTQMIVEPTLVDRARIDIRDEVEHRLLYQLVEFGIKEHVWPTAPRACWDVWSAEQRRWLRWKFVSETEEP